MRKFKSRALVYAILVVLIIAKVLSAIIDIQGAAKPLTIIDGNFHVTINGKVVEFNDVYGHPKLIKETERTLVPLRIISEQMGYQVDWKQETKTAIIKGGDSIVEISIGENTALVNGKRVAIDTDESGNALPTKSMLLKVPGDVNPRTYVPLRFISETTGADIKYKNVSGVHHITITTKGNVPPVETGKITFDPKKDITADGRITEEKTIEYLEEMIKNIKVIQEGGKYFLKYDHIQLPSYGNIVAGINFTANGGVFLSTSAKIESERLPENKSFKVELSSSQMKDSDTFVIRLSVLNKNTTNKYNVTTANLSYNRHLPTNNSEYLIFNEYNTKIKTQQLNKSEIFGSNF